jgi:hypothetical protein
MERAAMQRLVDGALEPVPPAGRILRPTNLADPDVYRVRWTDGSTHLWTSRRRRAGMGEATSGLRHHLTEPTA